MLDKAIDRLCRLFSLLMVACLAGMVFGNVVLRYGFNSGITVSEELSRLPPAGKKACFVLAHLLMLWLCWLMARGGWQQAVMAGLDKARK